MNQRATDPFQLIDQLDPQTIQSVVDRLEFRARDTKFTSWRDEYLGRLVLDSAKNLLDVGCGTGVIARSIAQRTDFTGRIVGIDPSEALLNAASRLADDEHVGSRIEFRVGDASQLEFEDGAFNRIVAHTTVSHVTEPEAVVRDIARVLAPDGLLAIFDGDYAS